MTDETKVGQKSVNVHCTSRTGSLGRVQAHYTNKNRINLMNASIQRLIRFVCAMYLENRIWKRFKISYTR